MNRKITSGYLWALALVPVLPLAILLEIAIPLLVGFTPFPAQLRMVSTVISVLTILSPPISVILAFLDWRQLGREPGAARFPWAWSFFAFAGLGIVYVAGRCSVEQHDTVRHYAPVRVNAVLIAAVLVVALAIVVEVAIILLILFTTMTPSEAGES